MDKQIASKEQLKSFEQTLKQMNKINGKYHPKTLEYLYYLAYAYYLAGDYRNAIKHEKDCYERRKKVNGEKNIDTISSLSVLAVYCNKNGQYNHALIYGEKAYRLMKEIKHEDDLDTIKTLNNLASYYQGAGQNEKALSYGQEVYQKRKRILGENDPETLKALNNLASYYEGVGHYDQALNLEKECYEKRCQVIGYNHIDTIKTLCRISGYYSNLGRYSEALMTSLEAYEQAKKIISQSHPDILPFMQNLAYNYNGLGDYQNALKYGHQCYEGYKRCYGDDNIITLSMLNDLALYYYHSGEYKQALTYEEKAYFKAKKILGKSHPTILMFMQNLSAYYQRNGDFDNALLYGEECYKRLKTIYPKNHPVVLMSMGNLATCYLYKGDYKNGKKYAFKGYESSIKILGKDHYITLEFLKNLGSLYYLLEDYDQSYTYFKEYMQGMNHYLMNTEDIKEAKVLHEFLRETLEAYFGYVVTSFVCCKEDISLLIKYKNMMNDIEYMKSKQNDLIDFYREFHIEDLQHVLPKNFIILDFYQYNQFGLMIESNKNSLVKDIIEMKYGLVLITKDDCKKYSSIEMSKDTLNNIIEDRDIKHIYICPDGDLYNVSFEELLPNYDISYLSSPKSLLWQNDDATSDTSVSVVCPDFDITKQRIFVDDKEDDHNTRGMVMNHLYGGFIEEKYLKDKLTDLKTYERKEANHDNFLSIKNPKVLHISTHGGYSDDIITDNHMEKGILYLSGYNDIQKGHIIDDQYGSGYVSANEIQFMDLKGTDLVVLSACSTAMGTSVPGGGVYGLRRAFELAGAKTLLMSQSPVDDFNTAIFIKTYFRYYNSNNPYEAMKETKKYLLEYDDNGIQNGIHELELLKEDFIEVFSQENHQMNKISMKQIIRIIDMKIKISKNNNALMKDSKNKETWSAFIIQGRI